MSSLEVDAAHYAYLYDRVAVSEARPQRYGTQFGPDREPRTIEDEDNLEARRAALGLGSMKEYREAFEKMYGSSK